MLLQEVVAYLCILCVSKFFFHHLFHVVQFPIFLQENHFPSLSTRTQKVGTHIRTTSAGRSQELEGYLSRSMSSNTEGWVAFWLGLSRVVDYSATSRLALIFEYKFHTRLIPIFKERGVLQGKPIDPTLTIQIKGEMYRTQDYYVHVYTINSINSLLTCHKDSTM